MRVYLHNKCQALSAIFKSFTQGGNFTPTPLLETNP